jgi:PadR family transcriptional regulator PadR
VSTRKTNPNFMNGVPELLILQLIGDREMYGYELVQAIREQTEDAISLGEGVVYPVLHSLERDGALTSQRRMVNGRSRVYYTITPKGRTRLTDLAASWSRVTRAIQSAFAGGKYAEAV